MEKDIVQLFDDVSSISKFDIRVKSRKYCRAFQSLADCLNRELKPFVSININVKKKWIVINDTDHVVAEDDLFVCKNFEQYKNTFTKYKNIILRKYVCNDICECEITDEEIVNLNHAIDSVFDNDEAIFTERTRKIKDSIEHFDKVPIIVYGNSSSGKTVAVAQAISQLASTETTYTWIDLVDVSVEIEHFVLTVLDTIKSTNHVIVIDNVQAHPSKISWIIKALKIIYNVYPNVSFSFVVICWRSARHTVINLLNPIQTKSIECQGDDIIVELIRKKHLDKYEKDILSNSAGDVFVAKNSVEFISENGNFPTENKLAKMIYAKCTKKAHLSDDAIKVLYSLVALGEFEIHVREGYLRHISEEGYNELNKHRIFRTYKTETGTTYVSIGHRSLAHKICIYLSEDLENEKSPIQMAIEYLNIEGDKQILSTLERLDLELEVGESTFANLWQAFCNMRASIIKQISVDPTWGNNMASMVFAAEALHNMQFEEDSKELWQKTANEIRAKWGISDDFQSLICFEKSDTGTQTSEIVDFTDNIKRTMEQDESENHYLAPMMSNNIDFQKFHDNWLLGLLLGFEGISNDNSDNTCKYIKLTENIQASNGSFYPERVPWVTARVIMGLCQCGLSYSDEVVKKACNWLVNHATSPEEMHWTISDMKCYGWRSGTGTWNSDEQITLMCLCALFMAEYPIRKDQKVSTIVSEFWRCRKSLEMLFDNKGNVLDVMWIIDVMLFDNRNPIDLKDEIKKMTDYLMDTWSNASLLSSEKETESSDVSFMAKELVVIIWALLNKNLEQLLKGLELGYSSPTQDKKIFISYRREEGGGSAFAQGLYKALNSSFKNDVFLDVYDLNGESRDFDSVIKKAIDSASVVVAIISDHAFDRACSSTYDNSKDVFYNELSSALSSNKNLITVYNSSLKRPECPEALKVNPDFFDIAEKLSRRNATFYDSTIPDAMDKLKNDVVTKINHLNI